MGGKLPVKTDSVRLSSTYSKANYNKQISKVKLQDAIIYDIIKIR